MVLPSFRPVLVEAGAAPDRAAFTVEALDLAAAAGHARAWADLARRALEPDIFGDPLFALPAARRCPPARRPLFVLVWMARGRHPATLVGLCPVARGRGAVARAWTHEQAVGSAPLLDAAHAPAALDALLDWLARTGRGRAGLLCTGVALDGPLGLLLAGAGHRSVAVGTRTRAVLTPAGAAGAVRGRRAKELRRQGRRLGDLGRVELCSARDPTDVAEAVEQFLTLEASGWKGRRGTALGQDPALALFTRTLTADLAREGRCRIDGLQLDGRPVAMGIVLRSRDRAWFWKTAFDERFAGLSPGKQLALGLTAAQGREPDLALTDSCALPGHPMIDRLWPERATVADLLVAHADASAPAVVVTAAWLRARARGRAAAKALGLAVVRRLRGRDGATERP